MLALLLALAAPACLQNARLSTRDLDRPLPSAIAAAAASDEPSWVGWSAPLHGTDSACRSVWEQPGRASRGCCGLESSREHSIGHADGRGGPTPRHVIVLVRVERGAIDRIRAYTDDCPIDAESRRVTWLDGVDPARSVAWLESEARAGSRRRAVDAVDALALHAGPEAVPALVGLARNASSGETRGQALFWLAQRAGAVARAAITRAIEEDPETEVKRRAVFALSEMPPDEGVPLLIDLARRHRNPAVREQAFFWLGESEDPRAVAFFEEVLR